ncbi:MAG: hypothetical protein CMH91_07620 [Oceanicaulis sp.]|nr:hypothetical protein [Oceanicaulis sp.]HBU61910.1 hypothetical protein [Oceanicaulis sp.]HCR94890.1 hypothetical protein [Oceanicaulis sp.]|tara:strand:- start:773 stop:982 length:210 start_codon:yes stop_codon:yes gene_type:complete
MRMTDHFDPMEAKRRVDNASRGHKQIMLGRNYERCHDALRRWTKLSRSLAELPALDRAAMREIERGAHG